MPRGRLRKVIDKPSVTSFKIFAENFASIGMLKTSLVLNLPIYVGMNNLDLSKSVIYDFHYNHVKANCGPK